MTPTRKVSRRSFVGQVAGGAAVIGFGALGGGQAFALQVTDSDYGANADSPGRGRGNAGRSGITDRDPSDPAGNGRGLVINPQVSTGSSGAAGAQSDPTNSGSGASGPGGATASPGATSGASRRCTDSDLSPADPVGHGRRC